ncbi:surface-adhesin E family protein [Nitrosomonas sp.]|uniref:surface-adhesin E family protein n=1 Tax=Nitrosomonas sp. TaxID=42353 RepID=UPI0025E1C707|nr:surface-adhesin E family protein [Nitrosomonas sp.]
MIKLLALAMILISTNAMAEWTKVGESDLRGGFTAYADLTSISKVGDRAKMWALFDYQTVQKSSGVEYLSEIIRRDYDCKQKQMRKLAYKFFSWNMEGGDLIRSYNQPQKWVPVPPDSVDEAEWKIACND